MKKTILIKILVAGILVVLLISCSFRKLAVKSTVDMLETSFDTFENQYDDIRMFEKAAPTTLVILEMLLTNDPENKRLLVLLSKGYFIYSFGFLNPTLEAATLEVGSDELSDTELALLREDMSRYYGKGADYALRAIELRHPGSSELLTKVNTVDAFVDLMTVKDAPALFWHAFNLGGNAMANMNSMRAMSKMYLVETLMARVVELDPEFYYGSAHLVLMMTNAAVPEGLGGNLDNAMMHYQAQKTIAGDNFLLSDLLYARFYLTQKQDRETYEAVLKQIIDSQDKGNRYVLLNKLAANLATVYLEAADRFFE